MNSSQRGAKGRFCPHILWFALMISPLTAQEKQTTYRFQNIDFPSLSAADSYMRHNTYLGGLPDPSANWIHFLKRQDVPPGSGHAYLEYGFEDTEYAEVPAFLAYMTDNTAVSCDVACPILDEFGNDFCTANIWPFCLSDGPIIDTMLELESRPSCAAEIIAYPAYAPVLDNLAGFQAVWQFPNGNDIQASGFAQYKGDLSYTSYFAGCDFPQTHVQSIYPHTSVYCPVGYNRLIRTGEGHRCSNPLVTRIYEIGAVTPEPAMSCGVENPCHPTTGNKSLVEIDYSSPTLFFARSYHSMTHYDDFAGMGRGWTHNFAQRILDFPGQAVSAKKMIDGKGNVEHFECADTPVCSIFRSVSEAGKVLMPSSEGWVYRAPNGEQRTFDGQGRLGSIEWMDGDYILLNIHYGPNGKVDAVTDQFGRRLRFHYNKDGLMDALELPSGNSISFAYVNPNPPAGAPVERQNLIRVVREDGSSRTYHYEDRNPDGTVRNPFLLTGITDELGARFATYAYDEQARVVLSEHAAGANSVKLNYTHRTAETFSWSVTEVTGALGAVLTYDMDAGPFRKVTNVSDDRGRVSVDYDPVSSWRIAKTDRNGNRTAFRHDRLHETLRTEAAGSNDERVLETLWDDDLNRILELREPGKVTLFTYNARGQIEKRSEADAASGAQRNWTFSYFEAPAPAPLIGRLKAVDGPRTDVSDVTAFEYYVTSEAGGNYLSGDLKSVVNPLGHRTEYLKYDANGRPLQIRDANGVLYELTYEARGWLSSQAIAGQKIRFIHDAAGSLTSIAQPDGSYTKIEYDQAHRVKAVEDGGGNRVEYTLDAKGNRIAEDTYDHTDDLRRQVDRVFDNLGRLALLMDGNGDVSEHQYDGNGNLIQTADPDSTVRTFEYDSLNRLVKAIDGVQGETRMYYDARDNLIGVRDPLGNLTQYVYDGLDNLIAQESPDSGVTTYEFDPAGNRTAMTDARGIRTEYRYDALNRLIEITYPDRELDVRFAYDRGDNGTGRLSSMVDASGTTDYLYDERGNLLLETRSAGSVELVTAYDYNAANRLVRITYPSGMAIDYTLDAAGRIRVLEQTTGGGQRVLIGEIEYEPFGPVRHFVFGNGATYNADFDRAYELRWLQSGAGLDWQFVRDPSGNIVSIVDGRSPSFDQTFSYDALHRLRAATGNYGSEIFDYDDIGNRTRYRNSERDLAYRYETGSNRISAAGPWTLTRDPGGNRVEKLDPSGLGYFYGYADDNRLARFGVRNPNGDGIVAEYGYDGQGRRAIKTVEGGTTRFVYGLNGELLGTYSIDGDLVAEYVYLYAQPVAVLSARGEVPPAPTDIIVDNNDPGTSSTGSWRRKTNKGNFGGDYFEGEKSDTFQWTPSPIRGTFDVSVWWVAGKKYSKSAAYTVVHSGVSDVIVTKQDETGGQWHLLGTFDFVGSGLESVKLHSLDGKKISADAVRFTRVGVDAAGTATDALTFFLHSDQLGAPRQVSDETQTPVWRWDPRPFGNTLPNEDPDGDGSRFELNLRFPGQYYDTESGLNYNFYRNYDPSLGRFIESDPIGLRGSINTFAYVGGDPTNAIDPSGLIKLYGNWCGPDWTGGFRRAYDELELVERAAALAPIDRLDQCCKTHDIAYADCRKRFPCAQAMRQRCFQRADRAISNCAAHAGGGQARTLFLGGNPQKDIENFFIDRIPPAEKNADYCGCDD